MGNVRWDSFSDLEHLQEKMTNMFEEASSRNLDILDDDKFLQGTWMPAIDIYETKDKFILEADVPGIKQENINIKIDNNILTLRGIRQCEKDVEKEDFHCIERSFGCFSRNFSLPENILHDDICANLKDGILKIEFCKLKNSEFKRIDIQKED